MGDLTTNESILYAMSREDLARHGRAVEQAVKAAYRSLGDFTVCVLGLPPRSDRETVMRAAAAAGLVDRCRTILRELDAAIEASQAYSETLRRRGLT